MTTEFNKQNIKFNIPEKGVVGWDILVERLLWAKKFDDLNPEIGMGRTLWSLAYNILEKEKLSLELVDELVERYKKEYN